LKSSSGSGALWFLMYSAKTSSVTLPLLATQYPRAENGEPIFRNPYNVVLAVPDPMAAAFVALHDPVYTGHAAVPCRLKAWGFLIPYRGL
jgi:hypothetical protein